MSDYLGTDLIQDPDEKSWSPRTGWTIGRPFRGSQTQIETAMAGAVLAGDAFDMKPGEDGGFWKITIYYGAEETQSPDEPIVDVWEMPGGKLEKELWDLPFVRNEFVAIYQTLGVENGEPELAVDSINWIRKTIEKYVQGSSETFKDLGNPPAEAAMTYANLIEIIKNVRNAPNETGPVFNRLIRLFAKGVKAFPVSQFVLRRTRAIANNFNRENLLDIYDDIFKRRTTDSLKSAHPTMPEKTRIILPPGEWVKLTPDFKESGTKCTITEEWEHADVWEEEIYGEAV